jgi:signal peptide peptidase SppA
MKQQFLIAELLSTPWALRRDVLAGHAQVLARWVAGGMQDRAPMAMDDDDGAPRERISAFEARSREANARVGGGGIAVIPVFGTIVQRAGMMTEWCGGTSTQQVSRALKDALADETVSQILMEFDSPGGSVYGVAELGAEIYDARKAKPVIGAINSLSASAGYWLSAQCSEVYCTPGGEAGSIGVWMAHEDWSKAMEEWGISTTLISAGKYKVEGNPYQPLSDEAKAHLQSRVDDYYAAFTKAVARGRGVGIEAVRSGMGQGRVLGAEAALAEKMIDGIATVGDVVRNMQKNIRGSKPVSQRSALAAARREIDLLG